MVSALKSTLSDVLVNAWLGGQVYADIKAHKVLGGTLVTAWDGQRDRVTMKFVVNVPLCKVEVDALGVELMRLLREERDKLLTEEIYNGNEDNAMQMINEYGPHRVDLHLIDADDDTRWAIALGHYPPELVIHVAPVSWKEARHA